MNKQVKPRPISVDDLQLLYNELRGSKSAPPILDAKAFLMERQMAEAHSRLSEALATYRESRQRVLRQDPEKQVDPKAKDRDRQVRRLKRKQEKAIELIGTFERLLSELQRLADREKLRGGGAGQRDAKENATQAEAAPTTNPEASRAVRSETVSAAALQVIRELIGDRQLEFVSGQFDFMPLESVGDVVPDAVYLLRRDDHCLLVRAEPAGSDPNRFRMIDMNDDSNRTEFSRERLVEMSRDRKLVLLLTKQRG